MRPFDGPGDDDGCVCNRKIYSRISRLVEGGGVNASKACKKRLVLQKYDVGAGPWLFKIVQNFEITAEGLRETAICVRLRWLFETNGAAEVPIQRPLGSLRGDESPDFFRGLLISW